MGVAAGNLSVKGKSSPDLFFDGLWYMVAGFVVLGLMLNFRINRSISRLRVFTFLVANEFIASIEADEFIELIVDNMFCLAAPMSS